MEKKYTKTSMLLGFLKGSKRFFIASILAGALVAGLDMVTPQVIRVVVDYCLANQTDTLPAWLFQLLERSGGREFYLHHLYLAALLILVVAVFTGMFQYLNTYWNAAGTEKMVKTARDWLFAHIEALPFDWHMKNQTGDIIQRCTSDVNTVRNFVSEQLTQVIRIGILILFSVICMASMSGILSLVVFLSVPIMVLYSYFFYQRIGHLFQECDENEGVLSTITQENLTGVRVVRAFGREEYEKERFRKQNHFYTDAWMHLCRYLSGYWACGDSLMGLQLMLLVVIGTILCVNGRLTAGELIAFISINQRLIWPVRRLGRMISEMSKAGVSMDRLLYILNSDGEEKNEKGRTPELTGDIEFDHVSFGYEPGNEILKDVNLKISGGSTIGILGPTGSGKTTLLHLLNRLYEPTSGEIRIGGVPVREMNLSWLRSQVGMVLQEPFLFSRTIGENISIAGDVPAEDTYSGNIMQAVEVAALTETIENFSQGLNTMVGERGVTLSGGQKQRVAIARMLAAKTPILIFDDSLSAVDAETDEKIRKRLRRYLDQATVILVSHRISTLMEADEILVLEAGKITARGTHKELLKKSKLYRHIDEIQNPKDDGGETSADCPSANGKETRSNCPKAWEGGDGCES